MADGLTEHMTEKSIRVKSMFSKTKTIRFALLAVLTIGLASVASAQVLNSGAQTINLNATLAESLTLSLTGNSVNFTLAAGSATNAGSTGITATTKWLLKPGRTAVGVYAYFTSSTALTDGGGNIIPASAFLIKDNAAPATALTAAVPAAFGASASGYQMENITITGANKNSQVTDAMTFNIDLSGGTLPQLPAGSYTGTLNIQAQATP